MVEHTPQQERSRETAQRLLQAVEAIITEEGLGGLSVKAVVQRTGLSVGAVYGRFRDKDGMLQALHRARLDRLEEGLEVWLNSGQIDRLTRAQAVRLCVSLSVAHYIEHGALMAAFASRAAVNPEAWRPALERHNGLVGRLSDVLERASGPKLEPSSRAHLELALHMIFGTLGDLAVHGEPASAALPFRDEGLIEALTRAVLLQWTGAFETDEEDEA